MPAPDSKSAATVLELTVRNHPGVMSHICGLFSRRTYNLEGIACVPVNGNGTSRMWLLVDEDERLDQVVKQVMKLEDVLGLVRHEDGHPVFDSLNAHLG